MKNQYRKINARHLSLGELVAIVGSCARNDRETLAALADLFESGRVRLLDGQIPKRVRLGSPSH